MEHKLQQARYSITQRGSLQTRLQDVLSSVAKTPESFYTAQLDKELHNSLITIFDNGIDPDPLFSGPLLSRIYLDKEKNLCLVSWPTDKEKPSPWRKEILLSNVDDYEFQFLGKTTAKQDKEKIFPINATYCWRTMWPKSTEPPSLIRLIVKQKEKTIRFAFILPSVDPFITYTEKTL